VLLLVLIVAVLNLALGACVAIVQSQDWTDYLLALKRIRLPALRKPAEASPPPASPASVTVPHGAPPLEVTASDVPRLDLPSGWHERLAEHQVTPVSVLEAVLHLVHVELEFHRGRWIAAEQSLRAAMQLGSDGAVQAALGPLRAELEAWIAWVKPFLTALKTLRGRLGEHVACADRIEESLLDQASRIEPLQEQQNEIAQATDKELSIRKFLREYAAIFEMAHALRDYVLDQLATFLRCTGRLVDMPAAWMRDSVSGYPNRLGLESLMEDWFQHDPTRKRLITGAFIEIDRLGKLNERLGVQQSDQVIKAFAKLVEGVVRGDRGDRVARVAGPTMFVLLSDAGVAGAKAAAERIRQTVEAATFQTRREEFTLAANCAVCDFLPDEAMPELLGRLRAGITEAKRGGRNRTATDEGQGPVLFDAQPIQVRAQTIQVA